MQTGRYLSAPADSSALIGSALHCTAMRYPNTSSRKSQLAAKEARKVTPPLDRFSSPGKKKCEAALKILFFFFLHTTSNLIQTTQNP